MDEAIDLLRKFISAEHEARVAAYTMLDDSKRRAKAEEALQYFDPSELLVIGFAWERTPSEDFIIKCKPTVDRMRPRILFQIKQYKHPELDALYRAYLSHPFNYSETGYDQSMYLARTEDGLKIISQYAICMNCNGIGTADAEMCEECQGTGWEHAGGMQLERPGELVEVRKFEAPLAPVSRADYDSE